MAKTILRLVLPKGEESAEDGGPTSPRRWLKVESKLLPGATHVLDLAGVGDWRYLGAPERVKARDLDEAILETLGASESLSAKALASLVGRPAGQVRAALERLEEAGRIKAAISTTPRGGTPARRYTLAGGSVRQGSNPVEPNLGGSGGSVRSLILLGSEPNPSPSPGRS